MSIAPFPFRKLLRFRLRTLLLITAVLGVGIGLSLRYGTRKQHERWIAAHCVEGEYVYFNGAYETFASMRQTPTLLSGLIPKDWFAAPRSVVLEQHRHEFWEHLGNLTSLEELTVNSSTSDETEEACINARDLQNLATLHRLTRVRLANCKLETGAVICLAKCSRLETLEIQNTPISEVALRTIATNLSHVRSLVLLESELRIAELASLKDMDSLESFQFEQSWELLLNDPSGSIQSDGRTSSETAPTVIIDGFPKLQTMNCVFSSTSHVIFCGLPRLTVLRCRCARDQGLSVSNLPRLTNLDLEASAIEISELPALQFLKCSVHKSLTATELPSLERVMIDDVVVESPISHSFSQCPSIRQLQVTPGNDLTPTDVETLCGMRRLEDLQLDAYLAPRDWRRVAALPRLSTLRLPKCIDLIDEPLPLEEFPALRRLVLVGTAYVPDAEIELKLAHAVRRMGILRPDITLEQWPERAPPEWEQSN